MSIGKNIKSIRESKGYTQAQLADMLGLSDKTVSSWENDRTEPKMGMVEKIAVVLNCLKSDIIGSDGVTHVRSLSSDEEDLLSIYGKLNDDGKTVARQRLKELSEIPRYIYRGKKSSISGTG